MSKKAFEKIKFGLLEALAVVRGKTKPSRTRVVPVFSATEDLKRVYQSYLDNERRRQEADKAGKPTILNQDSGVMKSASSAASRTEHWSPAKKDFAHRATRSGALALRPGQCVYYDENGRNYADIVRVLDNPPPAGPELKALMNRRPLWQK